MSDYQAIVIGSGAGGLAAALRLARLNFTVLLLEAMPSFGGYINPFHRKGYTFDTGLHFLPGLDKGGDYWKLLEELGINDKVEFLELDQDGFDRYIFPDYEIQLCKGKERFKDRLISEFPKEEKGIIEFFNLLNKIINAIEASRSIGSGLFGMLGFILKHPVMLKYSNAPYQKLLDHLTSDIRLKAILSAPSIYYGPPPAKASAILPILIWNALLKGGYYPHRGSGAFKKAFLSELSQYGVEVKNNSCVVSIDKHGSNFSIRTKTGEEYSSRVVISNVDPVITLGKIVKSELVNSNLQKKVKRFRPSEGSFYAFIGTDLDLRSVGITDANIIHYESYDLNKIYEELQ